MDHQTRLSAALSRLASATSVSRARAYDASRAERDGQAQEDRLEAVVSKLEGLADELWVILDDRPSLKSAA